MPTHFRTIHREGNIFYEYKVNYGDYTDTVQVENQEDAQQKVKESEKALRVRELTNSFTADSLEDQEFEDTWPWTRCQQYRKLDGDLCIDCL